MRKRDKKGENPDQSEIYGRSRQCDEDFAPRLPRDRVELGHPANGQQQDPRNPDAKTASHEAMAEFMEKYENKDDEQGGGTDKTVQPLLSLVPTFPADIAKKKQKSEMHGEANASNAEQPN